MDWPQKLIFALLVFCSQWTTVVAQTSAMSSSRLDFSAVLEKVRHVSHALKRTKMLVDSAEESRLAVEQQSAPSLQLTNSLAWQTSASAVRQQHALTLSTTLWDFGRQNALELKALAQVHFSEAQAKEVEELLKGKTARFFVSLVVSDAVWQLAREQSKNAESKLQTVTAAYKKGERPQTDVVKLKVEAGRAKLFAARARDEYTLLASQFQLLTQADSAHVNPNATILIHPLKERTSDEWLKWYAQLENKKFESAVLVKSAANERVLQAELNALEAEEFPQVGASLSAQASGSLVPVKPDTVAQLNLQYAFPFGAARHHKRSALRTRIGEVQLAQAEERKIRLDKFLQSKIKFQGLSNTLELLRTQITTLLDYQNLMRVRYFAGRASLLELTTTEDDLLAQRLELARLQANIYMNAIDAAEAVGGENIEALF